MQKLGRIFLLSFLLGWTLPVWADGVFKLGFVNTEKVFRDSRLVQSMQKKLEQEFASQKKAIEQMEKRGEVLQKQLLKSNLNAQERLQLEREYAQLNLDYRMASEEYSHNYSLRRNEEFTAIQAKANQLIKEIAEKEQFDLILQDAVYVKPQFDLTDRLIKALDNR